MKVLFLGQNLMARDRADEAARRAGVEMRHAAFGGHVSSESFDLVIIDLDELGADRLTRLRVPKAGRVVGYYSHVNVTLGRAASAAGIDPFPRGRFWRLLPKLLVETPREES